MVTSNMKWLILKIVLIKKENFCFVFELLFLRENYFVVYFKIKGEDVIKNRRNYQIFQFFFLFCAVNFKTNNLYDKIVIVKGKNEL